MPETAIAHSTQLTQQTPPPPSRGQIVVPCRHCGVKNRLYRIKRTDPKRDPLCGACRQSLLLGDAPLTHLVGSDYQHPWDLEALQALQQIPGIDSLLRKLLSESFERARRLFHFSSFLRCNERQAPRVYEVFREAAHLLDIAPLPDLFISHQESMNAYTSGFKQPYVAISAALVEELQEDELLVVFAHELGHWQSDHLLYKMATQLLTKMAGTLLKGVLGLGSVALVPLQLALLKWDRCSELTADRASLLAVRDPDVVIRTMMKLSGGSAYLEDQLDLEMFLEQVEEVKSMTKEHLLNRLISVWQELFHTHPMPIWRTAELLQWAEEGNYLALIAGDYSHQERAHARYCDVCGQSYPETLSLCPTCNAVEASTNADSVETGEKEETQNATDEIFSQVRDLGQGILNDVQGALQQGGSLLRQIFAKPDKKDKSK